MELVGPPLLLITIVIIMNELYNKVARVFSFLANVSDRVSNLEAEVAQIKTVQSSATPEYVDTTALDIALAERGY